MVVRWRGRVTSIPGYKDILWQLGLGFSGSLFSSSASWESSAPLLPCSSPPQITLCSSEGSNCSGGPAEI